MLSRVVERELFLSGTSMFEDEMWGVYNKKTMLRDINAPQKYISVFPATSVYNHFIIQRKFK